MKRLAYIAWIAVLASVLASCSLPGSTLKPGDKIGDMEFINEYESCIAPNFNEICSFDALLDGTCRIPASQTKFWVSTGLTADTQEELEQNWKDSEWEMTFDGHPVDLNSFGTFDFDLAGQKARGWNVCVSDPAPGKHTVRYDIYKPNGVERGNFTNDYIFTVLAPGEAGDTSSAAAPTPIVSSDATMIRPGDIVRDFLITTGGGDEEITYVWELGSKCVQSRDDPNVEYQSCDLTTDTKVNVSWGIYSDTPSVPLDEYWSGHTYEMYIDGRPVNLEAFGSIDVDHPQLGPMRHWNVVIIPKNSGEITVYSKGVVGGEPFEGSTTYRFSAP